MNILAVLAHHDKNSLSSRLFQDITHNLKKTSSVSVDVLDLYEHADQIPFYVSTKPDAQPSLEDSEFYQKNRERFMKADALLIVYPIYWYSVPGILKTWIDLITNFAWKFDGGKKATPLHHIKKLFVVNVSFQSCANRGYDGIDPSRQQLELTFDFMGISRYHFYEIDEVFKLTSDDIKKHSMQLQKQTLNYFMED